MRVFYAGAESHTEELFAGKVENLLFSYYYLKARKTKNVRKVFERAKQAGCKILIDSGAHTFFSEKGMGHGVSVTKKSKTKETYEEFLLKYIEWLKELKDCINFYVELDIHEIVGADKVENVYRPMFWKNGLVPILVGHPKAVPNFNKEWDRWCKTFSYCGLEGSMRLGTYNTLLNVAKRYRTRVHGFAMTKPDLLTRCPFYSVESTSWMSAARFGGYYEWNGARLLSYGKDDTSAVKKLEKKYGKTREQLIAEGGSGWVNLINIMAWKELEVSVNKRTKQTWIDYKYNTVRDIELVRKYPALEEYYEGDNKQAVMYNTSGVIQTTNNKTKEVNQSTPDSNKKQDNLIEKEIADPFAALEATENEIDTLYTNKYNSSGKSSNIPENTPNKNKETALNNTPQDNHPAPSSLNSNSKINISRESAHDNPIYNVLNKQSSTRYNNSSGNQSNNQSENKQIPVNNESNNEANEQTEKLRNRSNGHDLKSSALKENEKENGSEKEKSVGGKGKIRELLNARPDLEMKRRQRNLESMKGNALGFKTGSYAKLVPLYCNNCYAANKCPMYQEPKDEDEKIVCALRNEFKQIIPLAQTRDKESLVAFLDRLREIKAMRASLNIWFEMLDGGIQDKSLSSMIKDLTEDATTAYNIDKDKLGREVNVQVNLINQVKADLLNKTPEERESLLKKVREEMKKEDEEFNEVEKVEEGEVIGNKEHDE